MRSEDVEKLVGKIIDNENIISGASRERINEFQGSISTDADRTHGLSSEAREQTTIRMEA